MATVLVVDDSAMDRRMAGGLVERNPDWSVVYAADGEEALSQTELHLPDVVLTDMQMPGIDGLKLVEAMKRDYPLIPVIIMTAQGSEEIAVQALKLGAASYVPKSRLAIDLAETLETVLSASCDERSNSRLMHRMTAQEMKFVIENDASLIPSVVNYLQQMAKRLRLCDETETLRVGVALEEALLNAYYHGNLEVSSQLRVDDYKAYYELARQRSREAPYRERKIFVEAKMTQEESRYVVRDEGPGFDIDELPNATDPANLERPCGRGVLLMRTFMDEIIFNDIGNEVTLVKRRTPSPEETIASEASS